MSRAITIRNGSVRVKIFTSRSGPYTRYEIRWTDHHHRRHRLKRSNLGEARKEATRLAADLARGHHHAELSLSDLASFRAGITNLYGTGKTLELATAEYAEMHRVVPDVPPVELARFYQAHRPRTAIHLTVPEACGLFHNLKVQQNKRPAWRSALRSYLKKFQISFQGPVSQVTASAVAHWFIHLPGLKPRSKNNHLAAVQELFNLPELAHHPARTSIQAIRPIDLEDATVRMWAPKDFAHLLHTATLHAPDAVPVLVLGGFCKLRTSEIRRVDWADLRLADAFIALTAAKTKTRKNRGVTMPANAVRWLRACERPSGLVWVGDAKKLHATLRALARRAGFPAWPRNAMRKSACTYADLLAMDARATSEQAGNSPGMLAAHYLDFSTVTKADAEAWFAIEPPAHWQRATRRLDLNPPEPAATAL